MNIDDIEEQVHFSFSCSDVGTVITIAIRQSHFLCWTVCRQTVWPILICNCRFPISFFLPSIVINVVHLAFSCIFSVIFSLSQLWTFFLLFLIIFLKIESVFTFLISVFAFWWVEELKKNIFVLVCNSVRFSDDHQLWWCHWDNNWDYSTHLNLQKRETALIWLCQETMLPTRSAIFTVHHNHSLTPSSISFVF
mgnify:CR=1 FL=1